MYRSLQHHLGKTVLILLLCLLMIAPASAQGGMLTPEQGVIGEIGAAQSLVVYTFFGAAGDLVSVRAVGLTPGFQPALSLLSPVSNATLATGQSDPFDPGTTRITYRLDQGGVLILFVTHPTGGAGQFVLRLDVTPVAVVNDLTDEPVAALVGPAPQIFRVQADLNAARQVTISTFDADFGFAVALRNAAGQLLATFFGSPAGPVVIVLPPGDAFYEIDVRALDVQIPGTVNVGIHALGGVDVAPSEVAPTVEPPAATEEAGPASGTATSTLIPTVEPPAATEEASPIGPLMVTPTATTTETPLPTQDPNLPTFTPSYTPTLMPPTPTFTPTATHTLVPPTLTFTPTATHTLVPPTLTFTPTPIFTPMAMRTRLPPTLTFTPTATRTLVPPTLTFTPTFTSSPPPPVAPADALFNSPLDIPLDSTASTTDFVSYPGGDTEDMVRYSVTGMNTNTSLSGGRARLIINASCFGTGTANIQFFTGGQTFGCGQTIVDREVTADSNTGTVTITAVGGQNTYVQWVLTGTATRVN